MDPNEKLKKNLKGIQFAGFIATIGILLLSLGLKAISVSKGNALIGALNNETALKATLVIGAVIVWWGIRRTMSLIKDNAEIRAAGG